VLKDITSPALLACGVWGSGKTDVALHKILHIGQQDPGMVALGAGWLRATAQRLFKLFVEGEGLVPPVCPPDWIDGEPNKADMTVRVKFPAGHVCQVHFSGLKPGESDISRMPGSQFSFVIVEEATQIRDELAIEELETRAGRVPGAKVYQFLLLCNANAPGHWLYRRFYERKSGKPGDRLIELPTIPESAGILPSGYYRRLESLTGMLRQRYVLNRWVAYEGLVYPYDPRMQLLERRGEDYVDASGAVVCTVKDLSSWRCAQAADAGIDHPWVHQWWRVSPDDKWILQRESYISGRPATWHEAVARQTCEALGVPLDLTHDPAAALAFAEYAGRGWRLTPAVNDRKAGQQAVYELFPHALDAEAEIFSQCRIYFCADALIEIDRARERAKLPTCTAGEFGTYVWATGTKEDMVKTLDDGMDAMRYGIATARYSVPLVSQIITDEARTWQPERDNIVPVGAEEGDFDYANS
jgi:hypothetical protein